MSSELRKFACCFRADWRSHSDSFFKIAYEYIQNLPIDRKEALADEFRDFLQDSEVTSDEARLQLWYECEFHR